MINVVRIGLPAAVAALLLWFLASGQVYLLIHERSIWLVAASVPVLVAMTIAAARRRLPAHADYFSLFLLTVPVVMGLVIPARPLGSFAVDQQTATDSSNALWQPSTSFAFDAGNVTWDIHQLTRIAASDPSLRDFDGQRASLLGFVYRRPTTPADQFLVSRFVVRCCTADAVAASFPVHYGRSSELTRDTWVQVDGQIHLVGSANAATPVLEADSVQIVPQPSQPYLYP